MRQVTFAAVRTAIQVRYDLPDFSTTTKPTTTQINVMINQSAARLSALLVAAFGDDYFTTTSVTFAGSMTPVFIKFSYLSVMAL